MENTFRRAVFGGFNRQDVTEYISRTAREYSERLEQLEQENMNLRTQLEQKADLEQAMERLRGEYENAAQQLAEERTAREQLRRELEVSSGQAIQLAQLRQEAAEYSGVKEHLADIELEARRRADATLAEAKAQSEALLAETERKIRENRQAAAQELGELYEQYQLLTGAFQTAATHVMGELRRMDVATGQLPLAFDKARVKLEKLKEQAEN